MALIEDGGGRSDGGSGYGRLFGNERLGAVLSAVHAAVIRSGYELESLLEQLTPRERIVSLAVAKERIQSGDTMNLPPLATSFKGKGMVRSLGYEGHADIILWRHVDRCALVIELKDGDSFDTKKSAGELQGLIHFSGWLATVTEYEVRYSLCCFNQRDSTVILRGLKGQFAASEVLTGPDLCRLMGLDYDFVVSLRRSNQRANLAALAVRLLEVPEMRQLLAQGFVQESWLAEEQGSLFVSLDAAIAKAMR